MEENFRIEETPRYTKRWLVLQCLYIGIMAFALALIAWGIENFAYSRTQSGLLVDTRYTLLSDSIGYCFGIICICCASLMLIEIAFRQRINKIQYALIAAALTLFYLLLLAFAEKVAFGAAYLIVTLMTIGLIGWFMNGLTGKRKIVWITSGLLVGEFGIVFILINLGSMALLIGSLLLFLLIAFAMYFTLKLKVENQELTIK